MRCVSLSSVLTLASASPKVISYSWQESGLLGFTRGCVSSEYHDANQSRGVFPGSRKAWFGRLTSAHPLWSFVLSQPATFHEPGSSQDVAPNGTMWRAHIRSFKLLKRTLAMNDILFPALCAHSLPSWRATTYVKLPDNQETAKLRSKGRLHSSILGWAGHMFEDADALHLLYVDFLVSFRSAHLCLR